MKTLAATRIRSHSVRLIVLCTLVAFGRVETHATELLTNGSFESFTGGNPTGWAYTQGDGPLTLQSGVTSPFTNVYGAGANSLGFTDGATTAFSPNIIQSFASQTLTTIYARWDFQMTSLTGSAWTVQIDDSASASNRFNMDSGGTFGYENSVGANQSLMTLSSGVWYQVLVALDIGPGTMTVSITPFGGSTVTSPSVLWRVQTATLNRVVFIDLNTAANGGMQLDNFSVNTVAAVPEPGTLAAGALLGALVGRRLLRRRG